MDHNRSQSDTGHPKTPVTDVKSDVTPQALQQKSMPEAQQQVPVTNTLQQPHNTPQSATLLTGKPGKKNLGRKHSGVMLLTRTQLFLYIEGVEKVIIYPFPTTILRDLDIIDQEAFAGQISLLFSQHHLPPASFFVVLGNATVFARQIVSTDEAQKKVEEEKFLGMVPFEDVSSQHIVMGKNTFITAANKQLLKAVNDALTPEGSELSLALPEFLFSNEINLSHGLSMEAAVSLLKKMPTFKQYNFLQKEAPPEKEHEEGENHMMQLQMKGGKSNKKFVIAGAVFMVIGFFFAIYLWMSQQNTPIATPKPPAQAQVSTPPASSAASLASPSANVTQTGVQGAVSPSILINYSPATTEAANQLRSRLVSAGYNSIFLQNSAIQSVSTLLVFSPTVPGELRNFVTTETRKISGQVTVIEKPIVSSDVVITLKSN